MWQIPLGDRGDGWDGEEHTDSCDRIGKVPDFVLANGFILDLWLHLTYIMGERGIKGEKAIKFKTHLKAGRCHYWGRNTSVTLPPTSVSRKHCPRPPRQALFLPVPQPLPRPPVTAPATHAGRSALELATGRNATDHALLTA